MAGENSLDQGLDPVVAEQVDYIVSAFAKRGTAIGAVAAANGGVSYMYAEGHLVVREEHLGEVQYFWATILGHGGERPRHFLVTGAFIRRLTSGSATGPLAVGLTDPVQISGSCFSLRQRCVSARWTLYAACRISRSFLEPSSQPMKRAIRPEESPLSSFGENGSV